MVRLGAEELPDLSSLTPNPKGHAIQARLYAEDPGKRFQPSAGLLTQVVWPPGRALRHLGGGRQRGPALLRPHARQAHRPRGRPPGGPGRPGRRPGPDRRWRGSRPTWPTCARWLRTRCSPPPATTPATWTPWPTAPRPLEVLAAGTQTTVQDWPGRLGYWDVGVPPSGPMDSLAFRLGNRLLGNDPGAAGLELTVTGPTLRFRAAGPGLPHRGRDGRGPGWGRGPLVAALRGPRRRGAAHRPGGRAGGPGLSLRGGRHLRSPSIWAAAPPLPWGASAAMPGGRSRWGTCCT